MRRTLSAYIRKLRPARIASSWPSLSNRYTVIGEIRMIRATSATVTNSGHSSSVMVVVTSPRFGQRCGQGRGGRRLTLTALQLVPHGHVVVHVGEVRVVSLENEAPVKN